MKEHTGKVIVPLLGSLLLFSVMNVSMFNVAVPDIARELGLSPSTAGWVITGYAMVYAIGSLMYGKLADLYPLKRLMTIGILLFAVGSTIGFLAPSFSWLLAGRLIQSAGASSIPALAMIIPARYFPPERRGTVMGVVASFIAFSSGIGPVVGGFISGLLHWSYMFLLPYGTLLILPFLRRALPAESSREGHVDALGAGMLAGAISMLMLAITMSSYAFAAASAILLTLFVIRSSRAKEPFISLRLFTEGPFRYAILAAFLSSSAGFSMMLVIPMLLKANFQLGADGIGYVLFPAAMGAALLGRTGGRMTDRNGSIPIMLLAASLMLSGFMLLAAFHAVSPWLVSVCLLLPNIGFIFMQSSLSKLVSTLLPKDKLGAGMGVFSLTGFLSGAIGGSIATRAMDWGISYGVIMLGSAGVIVLQMAIVFVVLRVRLPRAAVMEIHS